MARGDKIHFMKWLFLGAIFCASLVEQQLEAAGVCESSLTHSDRFVNLDASTTLSQKVRDNAVDYWESVKADKTLNEQMKILPKSLGQKLVCVGDAHSGNFSPMEVGGRIQYTLYDIKDLGYASAIFDMNRLILNTLAVAARGRAEDWGGRTAFEVTKQMIAAYLRGLSSTDFRLTAEFAEQLPGVTQYQNQLADKTSENISGKRFQFKGGRLDTLDVAAKILGTNEALLSSEISAQIAGRILKADQQLSLLDAATRPVERGGSKDNLRIWTYFKIMTQGQKGTDELVFKELKEIRTPATAAFGPQPAFVEVLREAANYLDYDPSTVFPVVRLVGRDFFLRDRKVESLEVPYKQKSAEDFEDLLHMAKAHMIWLGTFHARQLASEKGATREAYVRALNDSGDELARVLYNFNLRYLNSFEVQLPWPPQVAR